MSTVRLFGVASLLLLAIAPSGAWAQQVAPLCTDDSRACLIRTASAYLDSIVAHDASRVPFAPAIRRTEQGKVTAEGEQQIRALQKLQPDMSGRANTRFLVDEAGHSVVAFALLHVTGRKADPNRRTFNDNAPAMPGGATVHLAERFRIEHGLITEIEAIFTASMGAQDEGSGWPDEAQ